MRTREEGSDTAELEMAEVGALNEDKSAVPTEKVSERLLGAPTVVVDKLKKTFGENTVVNNLSFSMYENQIFALLGHNGAGKV